MVLLRTKRQLRIESTGASGGDIYIELSSTGAHLNVNDQMLISLSSDDVATLTHFLVNFEAEEN